MTQQFTALIGPHNRGEFVCKLCGQQKTYGGWEDTEIYFDKDTRYHLGCLQDHYRELVLKTTLAYENLKSVMESQLPIPMAGNAYEPISLKFMRDAFSNLKGALRIND